MKFAKRLLMVAGVVALAGLFGVMLAPKAVHAVVATVVQVANTAAAPAITQGVPNLASQNVELICRPSIGCWSRNASCCAAYQVPTDETFVVADMEVITDGGGGAACSVFIDSPVDPFENDDFFAFSNDGNTHSVLFPGGITYSGGYTFNTSNVELTSSCNEAWLRGYLTSN